MTSLFTSSGARLALGWSCLAWFNFSCQSAADGDLSADGPDAAASGGTVADGADSADGPDGANGSNDSSSDAGGSSGGGSGDDSSVEPTTDCTNRSFACWPMPHPVSTGLPHPMSYQDLGDGTVKDQVTGLVWQKEVEGKFSYADAQTYCADLTLAGAEWRAPKRVELLSLHDFTRGSPALDKDTFDGTSGFFWTSSPWVVSQIDTKPQLSWIVNFAEGLTSNAGSRDGVYNVRCVQGEDDGSTAIPEGLYEEVATGEVRDTRTGIVWQSGDSGATLLALSDARAYCPALALNGETWRLPSIKELDTLVDENPPISKVSPAIDAAHFPGTSPDKPYWSSSAFVAWELDSGEPQWVLNFLDGFTQYGKTEGRVRCVR